MWFEPIAPVWMNGVLDGLVQALSTRPAAALLASTTVRLFKTGPSVIIPTEVPGSFTECTFGGYAGYDVSTILPSSPVVNLPSGLGRAVIASPLFVADGSIVGPGETALGYYVTDAGSSLLYMAEVFPTPIPFVNPGDFLQMDLLAAAMAFIQAQ